MGGVALGFTRKVERTIHSPGTGLPRPIHTPFTDPETKRRRNKSGAFGAE
jgi:hypothetical protein